MGAVRSLCLIALVVWGSASTDAHADEASADAALTALQTPLLRQATQDLQGTDAPRRNRALMIIEGIARTYSRMPQVVLPATEEMFIHRTLPTLLAELEHGSRRESAARVLGRIASAPKSLFAGYLARTGQASLPVDVSGLVRALAHPGAWDAAWLLLHVRPLPSGTIPVLHRMFEDPLTLTPAGAVLAGHGVATRGYLRRQLVHGPAKFATRATLALGVTPLTFDESLDLMAEARKSWSVERRRQILWALDGTFHRSVRFTTRVAAFLTDTDSQVRCIAARLLGNGRRDSRRHLADLTPLLGQLNDACVAEAILRIGPTLAQLDALVAQLEKPNHSDRTRILCLRAIAVLGKRAVRARAAVHRRTHASRNRLEREAARETLRALDSR